MAKEQRGFAAINDAEQRNGVRERGTPGQKSVSHTSTSVRPRAAARKGAPSPPRRSGQQPDTESEQSCTCEDDDELEI